MTTHVCSAAYQCDIAIRCPHAKAHDGTKCGPAMTCHDSGLLSSCVKLDEHGEYSEQVKHTCTECAGKGFHLETIKHKPL